MKIRKKKEKENVIYVEGDEKNAKEAGKRNFEAAKNLIKQKFKKLIIVAVALLLVVVGVYYVNHKRYKGYKVVNHSDTYYENTAQYIRFSGKLLKYTPDGVSYINGNGDIVWSAGVDMKLPFAVVNGDYAAVADINGNSVCIFNKDGMVSNLTMPYTICDIDVAKQGAFAVVLETEKTNYINLYDKNGEIVYEMQTSIDKSGYPLDITISNDGKKLFTSFINVTGNQVSNSLAAYNFGDVGQNENADRMVGGYSFDDQIVPKVEFIDNDTVVAFGTSRISIYKMKEKPSLQTTIDFDSEILSVFSSANYIGVIREGTPKNGQPNYKVSVYNLKGNKKYDATVDFEYDYIYSGNKELIISGGNRCMILRKNGSEKYNGEFTGNIVSVTPNSKSLEYVVVYDNATEIVKLTTDKGAKGVVNEEDYEDGRDAEQTDSTIASVTDASEDTEGE